MKKLLTGTVPINITEIFTKFGSNCNTGSESTAAIFIQMRIQELDEYGYKHPPPANYLSNYKCGSKN